MNKRTLPIVPGRGSQINPANRFTRLSYEDDPEFLEQDEAARGGRRPVATEYLTDDAKSIISVNDSPDIPFRYSLNVYRGCAHGCGYCFARPTHEYFELSAGLDKKPRPLDVAQFRRPVTSSGQGWLFS